MKYYYLRYTYIYISYKMVKKHSSIFPVRMEQIKLREKAPPVRSAGAYIRVHIILRERFRRQIRNQYRNGF